MMEHTTNEEDKYKDLLELVSDDRRIVEIKELSNILDSCFKVDYKDTFIVPEGEPLFFRGSGILVNGKNDTAKLEMYGEKEQLSKLLLRRNRLNRILAGETDCLKEPLTPELLSRYKTERESIQEALVTACGRFEGRGKAGVPLGAESGSNGKRNGSVAILELPPELDTPTAREMFSRAIKAGYMEITSTGYKWTFGGGHGQLARLAYFLYRVYSPKGEKVPETALCKLFNVKGLSDAYTRIKRSKWINSPYVNPPKWVTEIDTLF